MMTSMLGVNTVTVGDVPHHSMGPDRLPTIADAMAATTGISGEASYWATAFGPRRCLVRRQLEPRRRRHLGRRRLEWQSPWSPELWGGGVQTVRVVFTNSYVCVHKFCSLCVLRSMFVRWSSIQRGGRENKEAKHSSQQCDIQ